MKSRVLFRYAQFGSLATVCAVLSLTFPGCGGTVSRNLAQPVPYYRFPNNKTGKNIRLVSILTTPYAKTFEQGTLVAARGKQKKNTFAKPIATAVGPPSDLYVLDNGRGIIYHMSYNSDGQLDRVVVFPKQKRTFPSAVGIALTPSNNLWVAESRLKAVFVLAPNGAIIDSITGMFTRPIGIAYHPALDKMLVTDLAANTINIFDTDGRPVATLGPKSGLSVEAPSFIAVGPEGNVYVVEALSARIKVFASDWTLKNTFGGLGDGPGFFTKPKGIAVDNKNRIYVADALFDNVQVFSSSGELLLTVGTTGAGVAEFWQPMGVTIDDQQRIFIADSYNRRVQVFRWEEEIQ